MSDTVNLLAFGTDVIGSADTSGGGSSGSVSVTADGVKTWSTLLDELFALTDQTKLTKDSCVTIGAEYHRLTDFRGTYLDYSLAGLSGTSMLLVRLKLKSSGSSYEVLSPSYSDASNSVATNGTVLRLYY